MRRDNLLLIRCVYTEDVDVFLRKETTDFIRRTAPNGMVDQALQSPGEFLFAHAGKDLARYLANTRIEMPDEVEYLLDADGARVLTSKKGLVRLIRLYDGAHHMFNLDEVKHSLLSGPLFDQSDGDT